MFRVYDCLSDIELAIKPTRNESEEVCAIHGGGQEPKVSTDSITWRKLTVKECERLQTVPDGYCSAVSNSRAYHALGNGWTVDVIAHILKQAKP